MSSSPSSPSSCSYNTPCAACKFLRRKCMSGCMFAPYFPPEDPQKFSNVHKIFGASNVSKLLNDLQPHQREDAVNSLAYEAEARIRDPVYGCVIAISYLQRQVHCLQKELEAANAEILRYACHDIIHSSSPTFQMPPINNPHNHNYHNANYFYSINQPSTSYDLNSSGGILPWSDDNNDDQKSGLGGGHD